jgi:UDP-N-acetylmuramate dehydrogenase
MELKNNFSLKSFNTFSIDVKARHFAAPETIEELRQILNNQELSNLKTFILGGGSNILFTDDFDGLIIHPSIKGKSIVKSDHDYVYVKAGAGEIWDEFVEWTVNNSYGGLENLSLVPGTIGACPVQNIGAYGVEVGELIEKVEAIDLKTGILREFSREECKFDYRNSIFKHELKGQYLIVTVYFKLCLNPEFKTHYGSVQQEIQQLGEINLINIRKAIIKIRQSKLPDPELLPNAGSFFKNPIIPDEQAYLLIKKFPGIVHYNATDGYKKIAAGWMIDYLSWKGKVHKGAAVHENQALVLVNKNNASGKEILELANKIQESVFKEFGINMEFEVNIL